MYPRDVSKQADGAHLVTRAEPDVRKRPASSSPRSRAKRDLFRNPRLEHVISPCGPREEKLAKCADGTGRRDRSSRGRSGGAVRERTPAWRNGEATGEVLDA